MKFSLGEGNDSSEIDREIANTVVSLATQGSEDTVTALTNANLRVCDIAFEKSINRTDGRRQVERKLACQVVS